MNIQMVGLKDLKYYLQDLEIIYPILLNLQCYFVVSTILIELKLVSEQLYYSNLHMLSLKKQSKLTIKSAYLVTKTGITNLIQKKFIPFQSIAQEDFTEIEYDYDFSMYFEQNRNSFLYVDNLNDLKETVYQYSLLWEAKEYLQSATLNQFALLYAPVHLPSFEYLMKKKLYSVAFSMYFFLDYDKNAKELLDENNDFLPFILQYQLDARQFKALQLCRKKEMGLLCFLANNLEMIESILAITKLDLEKMYQYLLEQENEEESLYEYYDYLSMAKELGYSMKEKRVLFPKNFQQEHDKLYLQMTIVKEPEMNAKIKELSKVLSLNAYQDDTYIILPASSIESLLDESKQQQNCVRTYCKRYSENKTQIYFLRKKSKMDTSFITVEVRKGKVVQARTKYNQLPDDMMMKWLKEWEKTLLPIEITN